MDEGISNNFFHEIFKSYLNNFYYYIAKHHASQQRPRSRCLTNVHQEILNDVVSIICFSS